MDVNNIKIHKLTQDNSNKKTVIINTISLELELKKYFKWRKNANYQRLYKQGSSKWDAFIEYLSNEGY